MAHGALQRRVVDQALLLARDQRQRIGRAVPFGFNGGEHLGAQALVFNQLGIARGERQITLGHHHVHVGEQGAEKRPLLDHLLQQGLLFRHALGAVFVQEGVDR
ncbi:hypothetical protein FQZ97_984990 [compost metagenome]